MDQLIPLVQLIESLPTLSAGDYFTGAGTLISLVALRQAARSSRLSEQTAERQNQLDYRIAEQESGKRYVDLLHDVNVEFEQILQELTRLAADSRGSIEKVFDKYDTSKENNPYLRHAFHAATEDVRNGCDVELTYNTGENLLMRLRCIKSIEREGLVFERPVKRGFMDFFRRPKRRTTEFELHTCPNFWEQSSHLYRRIPAVLESELFREIYPHVHAYREGHKRHLEKLESLQQLLEQGYERNRFELFKIDDMPFLGTRYRRILGDIKRIVAFDIPDFYGLEDLRCHDGIAYALFAGSVLCIVQDYSLWGRRYGMINS